MTAIILQNYEKLHSLQGLWCMIKKKRLVVLFTSDGCFTRHQFARFCKVNLSNAKKSARFFILASLLDRGMQPINYNLSVLAAAVSIVSSNRPV